MEALIDVSLSFKLTLCSTFNKHEATLYLLLEYAEMDLNAILKTHTTVNRMATVLYFWNQMLEVVKVDLLFSLHSQQVLHCSICHTGDP